MGFIKGYNDGANITLLNTIYHRAKKDENGKYGNDSIDIIFKDMDTLEKKVQHIENPKYVYYMANTDEGVTVPNPLLFIEKNKVHPIECKYSERLKSIAENTNNLEFFYDNIKNGNSKANNILYTIPTVFNADMDIEDYYRWLFDRTYKNEPFIPQKLFFDIEVDGINQKGPFPEMGECPVNAITLIDDFHQKVYTLLLENYNNPLIEEFKKIENITDIIKDFVRENVGGWKEEVRYKLDKFKYHVMFYDEEIKLIADAFNVINTLKPDFALAWNEAFDMPYLIARINTLGYNPIEIICHKDFKVKECIYNVTDSSAFEMRDDSAIISSYTVYLDQLIAFASRRKGQRGLSSYKLDFIGNLVAGIRKLDYSHITRRIEELPYKNYYIFVLYNIMDVIVQYCIEYKVGDIDFVYNKSIVTNTRYCKVHRLTTYLAQNTTIKTFWDMGYIMGNNVNKNNKKESFAGAYVADPTLVSDKPKIKIDGIPVNLCDNLDDFDYKALYPSIIDENNMAPNTQHGKIILPEILDKKENRFNNEYFDRTVWFIEDYVSHDRLNFCNRYLNLPTYEEMFDDIIYYFTNIRNSNRGIRKYDTLTGKRIMVYNLPERNNRNMVCIIDNTKNKNMCIIRRKVIDYDRE